MFSAFIRSGLPVLLFVIATISLIIILKYQKRHHVLKTVVSGVLIAVMTGCAVFLAMPSLKYLAPFSFTSDPVVFDAGSHYSVIWATNVAGSAKLEVNTSDGKTLTFTDAVDGLGYLNSEIHRVDVDKALLEAEGNTYKVSSKKTLNSHFYGYKMGEEIKSGSYNFQKPNLTENISFLTISDIQGGAKTANKVLDEINKNESFDFVLMLGDYSNQYNNVQRDIVKPLLQLAAKTSKGVIPCLYIAGNHEIKGTLSKDLNVIFPTPSPTNDRYFTHSYGQMFLTSFYLGDDHADIDPRYYGVSEFSAYREKQYEWFENEVVAKEEYKGYKYNIAISHIPIIKSDNVLTSDGVCDKCNSAHSHMMSEFQSGLEKMNIQLLISAHTHKARLASHPDVAFKNLQTGGVSGFLVKQYKTSVIKVTPDKIEYITYYSDADKTIGQIAL